MVQATSPLTESKHLEEAFKQYLEGQCDSLLTCVRMHRFFWTEAGSSINYDYRHRPRRQDFSGILMENGAFYINRVDHILQSSNRLSGRIGIYEMPDYTATEIDMPDDWIVLECLMHKYHSCFKEKKNKPVKVFLTDVDGVLTDGGMYYSSSGDEQKKFNTRDGMAFQLLREAGIKTGFLTSEHTSIVEARARKLQIDYLYQGVSKKEKLAAAIEICRQEGIGLEEVAYIGDDVNCYDLLTTVGYAACPSDAISRLKDHPSVIALTKGGGKGAVREFVELILMDTKS